MLRNLLLVNLIFLLACSNPNPNKDSGGQSTGIDTPPPTTANFNWLLGQWKRTNDSGNRRTFEHWAKENNGTYSGLGFTLENKDTVFKEIMSLVKVDDIWNLKVDGVNEQSTYFKFTKQDQNSFTCENPENEFPKLIKYWLDANKLKALISDGENEVTFDFENSVD